MRLRDTLYTGAASYVQMASGALVSLLSIPLALHFLSNEQFGLWSFTSQSLGYLLLLDFGVSSSVGRLMADPLHRGQPQDWNGWFNLMLVILLIQATVILGLGLLVADWVIRWFDIPAALVPEARQLWKLMLVLNAVNLPFRLLPGILAAQNRSYWGMLGGIVSAWLGLPFFYLFLRSGCGTLAYGWSALVTTGVGWCLPLWAVWRGPHRFHFSLRQVPWRRARDLFEFSSAVFLVGMAVQAAFMSQSLIITKLAGLSAVAAFTVCSRVPMLLMQLTWRPFDAFLPRWQIFWCREDHGPLRFEYCRGIRLTMGLALAAMICCLAANRWVVFLLAKPHLYLGKGFDLLFAMYVLAQVWMHCVSYLFVLGKRMNRFAGVVALDTALGLGVCILTTSEFGVIGYIGGATGYALVGLGFWFITLAAPPILGLSMPDFLRSTTGGWRAGWLILAGGAAAMVAIRARSGPGLLAAEIVMCGLGLGFALWLSHKEWPNWLELAKQTWRRMVPKQTA